MDEARGAPHRSHAWSVYREAGRCPYNGSTAECARCRPSPESERHESVSAEVWYRKWRPQSFAEINGQEHVTRTLANAVAQNRVADT